MKNATQKTKVFMDCSLVSWSNRPGAECTLEDHQRFDEEWGAIKAHLNRSGFEVMEFTQDESWRQDLSSLDLARQADIIIALGDYPSTGFSETAARACVEVPGKAVFIFWKQGIDFTPPSMPAVSFEALTFYSDYDEIVKVLDEFLLSHMPGGAKIPA